MKVSKNTLIKDVIKMGPKAVDILRKLGMGCIGCPSSQNESIEEAAAVHGIDVDKLIESLNGISLVYQLKWKLKEKIEKKMKARYSK
ncbi:DUF1858 domain-containing protein [Clostridium fermenticellae]|uniref:DUF1858 domain-containing protein n=1 Tax=Clostridium fermenticellae TaxID=2068654 RepID=A0A386H419_9CLOT|nr:DUF1858 domain-containing protein [Clostridium fermenticellae]